MLSGVARPFLFASGAVWSNSRIAMGAVGFFLRRLCMRK